MVASTVAEPTIEATADPSAQTTDMISSLLSGKNLYIIIGVCVLLFIIYYLYKRYVRAPKGEQLVLVKKRQIFKILKEGEGHFLVPFVENVGANVQLKNNNFSSSELKVNDGPDKLYQISYSFSYDVIDIEKFYGYKSKNLDNYFVNSINETMRDYVYHGNGDVLLRKYRDESDTLKQIVNDALSSTGILVTSFNVNTIQLLNK